jgi:hypothetical protein
VSQANVGKKLDRFAQEFKEGKREGSVISVQTTDTFSKNDKQLWYTIRKELEDIGITVAAFDANRDFIFEWFRNAIANGEFEERELCEDSLDERSTGNSDDRNAITKGEFEERELSEDSLDERSIGNFNDITSQTWFSIVI